MEVDKIVWIGFHWPVGMLALPSVEQSPASYTHA